MLAYQSGKAANVAPPATISQTSLPSQNGPMALRHSRRSTSSRAMATLSMPTPKSKPSSTKYTVHTNPSRANQAVFRLATGPCTAASQWMCSVDEFAGFRLAPRAPLLITLVRLVRAEPAAGPDVHEDHVGDAERGVHEHEASERDGHVGRRDTRRAGQAGLHQAVHDPGLPSHLGEQPAERVGRERGGDAGHQHPQSPAAQLERLAVAAGPPQRPRPHDQDEGHPD